jgi:hypothetical protein
LAISLATTAAAAAAAVAVAAAAQSSSSPSLLVLLVGVVLPLFLFRCSFCKLPSTRLQHSSQWLVVVLLVPPTFTDDRGESDR